MFSITHVAPQLCFCKSEGTFRSSQQMTETTIGGKSRLGVDYQSKNRVSFNDDILNTRFQIVWNVMY